MKKILFIVLMMGVVISYSQTIKRQVVFTKGEQIEKNSDIKFTNNISMMGQDVTTNSTTKMTTVYKVNDITDKNYVFGMTMKSITTDISAMGQQMSYNSDKPEDSSSVIGQMMKDVVGKSAQLTIDKNGVITDVDTAAEQQLQKTMMAGTSMMGNQLAVGKTFELIADLPAKPVKKGDSWTDSTGSTDSSKQVTTYTIQSIANNHAVILLNGTLAQKGTVEQNAMSISTNLTGKLNGQLEMETATGIITNRLINVTMTGTLEMMGTSAPTSYTITITDTMQK
ncbi:MAG: DUF6263 family protein [Chitinophagaceae bacterium]